MSELNYIVIVGGTHGNESTGVYLIKKFSQHPALIQRSSFLTQVFLGNPKAVTDRVRYIDRDLNRSFERDRLQNTNLIGYEDLQAKIFDQKIGPFSDTPADVMIDLHSTTANVGLTLIIDKEEPFTLKLAAYLQHLYPSVKVYSTVYSGRNQDSLRSLAKFGFGIEVGPVAQGVLDADLFLKTEALIYTILDYLEQYNQDNIPQSDHSLTLYRYLKAIDYPRDEDGEIQAMIHPQLQFRDYHPLHLGDPMFLTFEGETIVYEATDVVYPMFINEAAYYEKSIAMCLTQKEYITV